MFEKMTFESILKRALSRVKTDVDKRQGSVIYDALAPACVELALMYIELDNILRLTFAETSYGEWLEMRCAELGIYREPATKAIRLGIMTKGNNEPFDIPLGSRFNIEAVNYIAAEKIETGFFKMECEEAGIIGNQLFGRLTPIETVRGLVKAELSDVLIPGEDAETDERLYYRYYESLNSTPYGGNIDDYRQKVRKLDGVGDCKVFPVWQGGGTVKVCIITTEYEPPTQIMIETVQEALDPVPFHQQGKGIAPIGHYVTVTGVTGIEINIITNLVLRNDTSFGQVEPEIQEILQDYFNEIARNWADEDNLTVRINQIEARILNIRGIIDILNTTINSYTANIILGAEEIPILGKVILNV